MDSRQTGGASGHQSRRRARLRWPIRTGAALLLVAGVLYGSFLPFRVAPNRLTLAHFRSTFLSASDLNAEDIFVNVAVYAALAFGLMTFARRRNLVTGIAIFWLCCAVSAIAEAGQTLIPQRVSSQADLGLNVLGTFLGILFHGTICAALLRGVRLVIRCLRAHPWGASATLISAGLLVYGLLPFDFVTTSEELHTCFRRLSGPLWNGGLAGLASELAGATWFAALGWLIAFDTRTKGEAESVAVLAGLTHGLVLACLIETMQLFTKSHVPEAGAAMIRTLACLAGSCVGTYLPGLRASAMPGVSRDVPTGVLLMGATVLSSLPLLDSVRPATYGPSAATWSASLPFHSLWKQPTAHAGAHAFSIFVSAALLTFAVLAVLRRFGRANWRPLAGLFVVGLYLLAEGIAFQIRGSSLDATDALLALLSCGVALAADRQMHGKMMREP